VSKVTEKIKTRSKPTPSENFNSHSLFDITAGLKVVGKSSKTDKVETNN
jgi:hypothetical protein